MCIERRPAIVEACAPFPRHRCAHRHQGVLDTSRGADQEARHHHHRRISRKRVEETARAAEQ
eukprot:CAMPEP_0180223794 /NCGR_PEP_ID=MMETSP0987-20121128/21637_1 /TAXON_ID=697907 /ORGANISM="non described non described, Strain CCMP2293" /LENGTH=61 /DNA_ID=CAMNT_0022186379 /DNA_START=393 /DNA_END=578 /DNA_ORIENTATION=-